jgi:hypothetical protein
MQVVGDHLSAFAISIRGNDPADGLFARSAFNRYYYATFLKSRQLIIDTNGPKALNHSALPDYLDGHFKKTLVQQIRAGFRSRLLSSADRSRLLHDLRRNTLLLRQLLMTAYRIRVLADYEPDFPLDTKNNTYTLGSATLSEAGKWAGHAEIYCRNLHSIWKDLGN